jgi:hypothetical protein
VFKPTYGTLRRLFSKTRSAAGLSRDLNTQSNVRDDPAGISGPVSLRLVGRRVHSQDRGLLVFLSINPPSKTRERLLYDSSYDSSLVGCPRRGSFRMGPTAGRIKQEERPRRARFPGLSRLDEEQLGAMLQTQAERS